MRFAAPSGDYDRFMGRYTPSLAVALTDAAEVQAGMLVLDVGCGPGGLTAELAARVGAANVAAIDPAPQFVQTCRERTTGADVREGVAETLPWPDRSFDATLSSLVVGFMSDPGRGISEMARVTKRGGRVAACMWDTASGGMTMLHIFWTAVREVQSGAVGESVMPGTSERDLGRRFERAGLSGVVSGSLTAHAEYLGFDDFWEPFTFAIGPAGAHLRAMPTDQQDAVREACRAAVPDSAFGLDARAWYAVGTVPG